MKSVWRGETLPVPGDELGRERAAAAATTRERLDVSDRRSYGLMSPEQEGDIATDTEARRMFISI